MSTAAAVPTNTPLARRAKPTTPPDDETKVRGTVAVVIGIVALVVYLIVTASLWGYVTTIADEKIWGRYIGLYDGIRSFALAAAGFFFGAKVNLDRAEKAETKAETAETSKNTAENDTTAALTTVESMLTIIKQFIERNQPASATQTIIEHHLGPVAHIDEQFPGFSDFVAAKSPTASMPMPASDTDWAALGAIAQSHYDNLAARLRG